MTSSEDFVPPPLPAGLPVPSDDGAAAHLGGMPIPRLLLPSTDDRLVSLADRAEAMVLYIFPKMGRPDVPDPEGWNETPGARGCTQQSCGFRDLNERFASMGFFVAGLSAQALEEQKEAVERLHLPFPLLADPERRLADALRLPLFEIAGMTLYKRLKLIAWMGRIAKVFYPVFPPDANAEEVLSWIWSQQSLGRAR